MQILYRLVGRWATGWSSPAIAASSTLPTQPLPSSPTAKPTLKKSLFILGTKGKVVSFADESDKEDKTGKSVENQEQCTVQFRFKNFTKTKKIFFLLFKVHFSFGTTSFFFISFSVLGIRCKFFSGCAWSHRQPDLFSLSSDARHQSCNRTPGSNPAQAVGQSGFF